MKKILFILIVSITTFVFANQKQKISAPTFSQEKSITSSLKAYPNPLTTETQISFYTAKRQRIIFTIKNLLGKTVFHNEYRTSIGENNITFYKDRLESGMYIYSIQTESEIVSKRLVIR